MGCRQELHNPPGGGRGSSTQYKAWYMIIIIYHHEDLNSSYNISMERWGPAISAAQCTVYIYFPAHAMRQVLRVWFYN
jgi:hypothetical protein